MRGLDKLLLLLAADVVLLGSFYEFAVHVTSNASSPLEVVLPMLVLGTPIAGLGAIVLKATIDEIADLFGGDNQ